MAGWKREYVQPPGELARCMLGYATGLTDLQMQHTTLGVRFWLQIAASTATPPWTAWHLSFGPLHCHLGAVIIRNMTSIK